MRIENILSASSRVEVPVVIATIAGYTFGAYIDKARNVVDRDGYVTKQLATYPNFVKSINIVKINGAVNNYRLTLEYAIRSGDDPNLIDKIISSAGIGGDMKLSYGDLSSPSFFYKDELAMITKVTSSIDVASSKITYTILAISRANKISVGKKSFPAYSNAKPSDIIKSRLRDRSSGLLDVFSGMIDSDLVESKGLISGDDEPIRISAKTNISELDYLKYLVTCMTPLGTKSSSITDKSRYYITMSDDVSGIFGGPYFKIDKVSDYIPDDNSMDVFEIDIGYPGNTHVVSFNVTDDNTYSIYYDYSKSVPDSEYVYRIDDSGTVIREYAPYIALTDTYRVTEAEKSWWSKVTQFPINATLQIRGLLKPAVLMSYIKLNVLFYGREHITSGYYIITKQEDNIDSSGFKTTLSLTRISGGRL